MAMNLPINVTITASFLPNNKKLYISATKEQTYIYFDSRRIVYSDTIKLLQNHKEFLFESGDIVTKVGQPKFIYSEVMSKQTYSIIIDYLTSTEKEIDISPLFWEVFTNNKELLEEVQFEPKILATAIYNHLPHYYLEKLKYGYLQAHAQCISTNYESGCKEYVGLWGLHVLLKNPYITSESLNRQMLDRDLVNLYVSQLSTDELNEYLS